MNIQEQYDKIYSYFKNSYEPFDELEWCGEELNVILDDEVVETYTLEDLNEIVFDKTI